MVHLKLQFKNVHFQVVKLHLHGVKTECQVLVLTLLFMYLMLVHGMLMMVPTHVMLNNGV